MSVENRYNFGCIFCEIIAGREPAEVWYEDEEYIVFRNRLRWVPIMLLVAPKVHLSQEDFWTDFHRAAKLAVELGKKFAPGGFRLLSNFGHDALQTVSHGHLHLLGGTQLGLYV
jgi:histidine triad (HIT) family protein